MSNLIPQAVLTCRKPELIMFVAAGRRMFYRTPNVRDMFFIQSLTELVANDKDKQLLILINQIRKEDLKPFLALWEVEPPSDETFEEKIRVCSDLSTQMNVVDYAQLATISNAVWFKVFDPDDTKKKLLRAIVKVKTFLTSRTPFLFLATATLLFLMFWSGALTISLPFLTPLIG